MIVSELFLFFYIQSRDTCTHHLTWMGGLPVEVVYPEIVKSLCDG